MTQVEKSPFDFLAMAEDLTDFCKKIDAGFGKVSCSDLLVVKLGIGIFQFDKIHTCSQ